MIFVGFVLLALKVFNSYALQLLGLLGYLLIGIGLCKTGESKETRTAALGAFGLFILTGYEFIKVQIVEPSMLHIAIAIIQMMLFLVLNWLLIYNMFEDISNTFKAKKMLNDANTCQRNKKKFMSILLYSVLCQNGAIMFPKLGAIIFIIGVILAIYLSIKEVLYIHRVSLLMIN
ncbi:MAG: hypothetical protein RR531_08285 [Longicatena sp.]